MSKEMKWLLGCGVVALVACVCLSFLFIGLGAFAFITSEGKSQWLEVADPTLEFPDLHPTEETPTPDASSTPGSTPEMPDTQSPVDQGALDTLQVMLDTEVPINDPRDLAARLNGIADIPETLPDAAEEYNVGDPKEFWASNTDTNENFKVNATLQYETEHLYFWIEDGVNFDKKALKDLCETFENKIYPTDREFFGSEWTPGVDNDPHLYVLYTTNIGSGIAGYFSSADSLHPLAHEYSNAHEMFFISADNTRLDEEYTKGTLAHEFQHMIHWYRDRNEESWMNEGFSVLAELLNGYDIGGFDYLFMSEPDMQLTDWPNDSSATAPHYGAAFLFVDYFLDRFGEDATKMLVEATDNGMDSVDQVLLDLNAVDGVTGEPIKADDVFADWTVTNFLLDGSVADGRYQYNNYPGAPQAVETEVVDNCSSGDWQTRTVNQYGTDYILVNCSGDVTLNFQGTTEVSLLPERPYSGQYAFWSNKGDSSDMTLTRTFDLTGVDGPASIAYRTWYDLETDYDYLYLVASDDGGKTWSILDTPSCTTEDLSGNSYGCGYNGVTEGWIQEEVDLSKYAGKEVTLRFEYVTDAAVNGEGLLLDDVSIAAIGYETDFEADNGGWEANGFARVDGYLPQTYRVSLILMGDETTVRPLTLDELQSGSVDFTLGDEYRRAVLVVSGVTRFTRQLAQYQYSVNP